MQIAPLALVDLFSKTGQSMTSKALLKQIPIDSLGRGRPLTRCDNHLTVGRRHATCCIETGYARSQAGIHDDLPLCIDRGPNVVFAC